MPQRIINTQIYQCNRCALHMELHAQIWDGMAKSYNAKCDMYRFSSEHSIGATDVASICREGCMLA